MAYIPPAPYVQKGMAQVRVPGSDQVINVPRTYLDRISYDLGVSGQKGFTPERMFQRMYMPEISRAQKALARGTRQSPLYSAVSGFQEAFDKFTPRYQGRGRVNPYIGRLNKVSQQLKTAQGTGRAGGPQFKSGLVGRAGVDTRKLRQQQAQLQTQARRAERDLNKQRAFEMQGLKRAPRAMAVSNLPVTLKAGPTPGQQRKATRGAAPVLSQAGLRKQQNLSGFQQPKPVVTNPQTKPQSQNPQQGIQQLAQQDPSKTLNKFKQNKIV